MLLTICIPTRNRPDFVTKVVSGLIDRFCAEVEIIVSDNSDAANEKLRKMSEHYEHLRYYHQSGQMSFSDNFNFALVRSSGDYIVAIGDDDFVVSSILDVVKRAKNLRADTVTYPLNIVYYWPGVSGRTSNSDGILRIDNITNADSDFQINNQRKHLERFLMEGLRDYDKTDLARIYHGIVRRDFIVEIIKRHGRLYGGLSPDIYSSILLSFYSEKSLKWNQSLTIPGVCGVSGSGQSAAGKHRGNLAHAPHFRGNQNYRWEREVPYYYSVNTIWAESAVKALKTCAPLYLKLVNWNRFNAIALIDNLAIFKIPLKLAIIDKKTSINKLFYYISGHILIKIKNKVFSSNCKTKLIKVRSIEECEEVMNKEKKKSI